MFGSNTWVGTSQICFAVRRYPFEYVMKGSASSVTPWVYKKGWNKIYCQIELSCEIREGTHTQEQFWGQMARNPTLSWAVSKAMGQQVEGGDSAPLLPWDPNCRASLSSGVLRTREMWDLLKPGWDSWEGSPAEEKLQGDLITPSRA